jgi:L-seryl-tRNA(Ser) seleniumtransferase
MVKTRNPYDTIGVRAFINCCGTRTIHSGTLMLPEVTSAMREAAQYFVNMDELMDGVGDRLAELTGAEWGMVTAGAAASLSHATAACVTGGDPEKMLRLPDTTGMKHQVVMMRDGRFTYDHAIRAIGVEIVETTPDKVLEVLHDAVAMVALLGTREFPRLNILAQTVHQVHAQGIPVLVDAASEHLAHPDPYLTRGVDMVAYSGGKYLRGPQCTGLLLGRKAWIQMAWRCAAPHHTLGRAMKIGKEEVMGVLAAVEYWAQHRRHQDESRRWSQDLRTIADMIASAPSVSTTIVPGVSERSPVPRLLIRWDPSQIEISGLQLRQHLLDGTPRIMLDDRGATESSVYILPFSLQPGEAQTVGETIRSVLVTPPPVEESKDTVSAKVEGIWDISVTFVTGDARHQMVLAQDQHSLTGTHRTVFSTSPIAGSVSGTAIVLRSLHPYEGTNLAYCFEGTVTGDEAAGLVYLGTSGQSAPGPLNQQEYGTTTWKGQRRS